MWVSLFALTTSFTRYLRQKTMKNTDNILYWPPHKISKNRISTRCIKYRYRLQGKPFRKLPQAKTDDTYQANRRKNPRKKKFNTKGRKREQWNTPTHAMYNFIFLSYLLDKIQNSHNSTLDCILLYICGHMFVSTHSYRRFYRLSYC